MTRREPRRAALVMAKQPTAGSTKTRLLPRLTPQVAADLYECFLLDALALARSIPRATPLVAVAPPDAGAYFTRIAPGVAQVPQLGSTLGERLDHVLTSCLDQGFDQVIALNSDSPTMPASLVEAAFDRLDDESVDVVIGPADDGGYYLMGWKATHPELVSDVVMSTPDVLADTLDRAGRSDVAVSLLAPWYDVDQPDDLDRLRVELESATSVGSHTRRFLIEASLLHA